MVRNVIKRNGDIVPFDNQKIKQAIEQAITAVGAPASPQTSSRAKQLAEIVSYKALCTEGDIGVEQIQDLAEETLMQSGHYDAAKAFILYRSERAKIRNSSLMDTYKELTYSSADDSDIKRENANINGDTAMGTMLKYGSEGAKAFYREYILDAAHAKAHDNGDIHIHDLDFYSLTTTCSQIDLIKLFKDGFSTGHGFLREPNDIASYSALACIAIQSNQNDQHGGQSIPNFDYALADGVRKTYIKKHYDAIKKGLAMSQLNLSDEKIDEIIDEIKEATQPFVPSLDWTTEEAREYARKELDVLFKHYYSAKHLQEVTRKEAEKDTERATYQAMEALVHNLNTMNSRAGSQVPFSSINYGTDTSIEGRMVIRNILLATEAGLGNSETPIFPIQIFKVKEGINYNEGDPNYDLFKLSCRVSAKRLFPNYSFIDAPFNLPYYKEGDYRTEVGYMGCRTRVMGNVHDPNQEITTGRGNLSFTSINLPRIALLAEHDMDKFYTMLDERMDLVVEQLLHRFKIQSNKRSINFPFLIGQGVWLDSDDLQKDETIGEILKHGSLSIGFIGLAETLVALIGKHHGESIEARAYGMEIVSHMRSRLDELADRTKLNFTLLATPAEGLSGRFVRMDKEEFGEVAGVTDREYYTNSFHVPVYYPISAFEKINIEAPYHELTNAGHISYVELDGDPSDNLEAFEAVVRHMKEAGIGYGSINHPVDRDPVCGYTGIIGNECPQCGRKEDNGVPFVRIRRITGYLVGSVERFNDAKRAEEHDRVKHG